MKNNYPKNRKSCGQLTIEHREKIAKARRQEWKNGVRDFDLPRRIGKAMKGKSNLKNRKENPKTDESKLWRKRIEYHLWREAVFSRDNWICQKCKKRGGKLHPHHILGFAEYKELRFAIDNGITFCLKCHILFHKIYGKKGFNNNNLAEFIKI